LLGESDAITAEEKRGYEIFRDVGCASCHQGMNVGGNLFQRFGVASNFFVDRGNPQPRDLGRYNVTGDEADKFKFKVPTLRNVAKTGPYFHDGSVATLDQAVRIMAQYQLGVQIQAEDVRLIVAFLHTLEAAPKE
jgi:cytochrome c peroxidase